MINYRTTKSIFQNYQCQTPLKSTTSVPTIHIAISSLPKTVLLRLAPDSISCSTTDSADTVQKLQSGNSLDRTTTPLFCCNRGVQFALCCSGRRCCGTVPTKHVHCCEITMVLHELQLWRYYITTRAVEQPDQRVGCTTGSDLIRCCTSHVIIRQSRPICQQYANGAVLRANDIW